MGQYRWLVDGCSRWMCCRFTAALFTGIAQQAMTTPRSPDESAESSFWAWVYTEEAQAVICGILTDLNLHRFHLHQQLTTHDSLSETPLWHEPLHSNLPTPITQLLQQYRAHMNIASAQLRKALDVLDTLGRRPPRAYLLDPTHGSKQPHSIHTASLSANSTLQPGEQVTIAPNINCPPLPHILLFSNTTPLRHLPPTSPHTKCSKRTS